jgi:hypothetical protein
LRRRVARGFRPGVFEIRSYRIPGKRMIRALSVCPAGAGGLGTGGKGMIFAMVAALNLRAFEPAIQTAMARCSFESGSLRNASVFRMQAARLISA